MSAAHKNDPVCWVETWHDWAGSWTYDTSEGAGTGVFERRTPRDSYAHERPLLAVKLDPHADDLPEYGSAADEATLTLLRPTLRP